MEVIDKKSTTIVGGKISRNIITAGLVFSISTASSTFKPIDKGLSSKNSQYADRELKIESDAYDLIRKKL